MFELIEIELTRILNMAQRANEGYLVYLIQLALVEAHKKARSRNDNVETPIVQSLRHDAPRSDVIYD